MSEQEKKRFDNLPDEARNTASGLGQKTLSYDDLFDLLKNDKRVRKLIKAIAKGDRAKAREEIPQPQKASGDYAENTESDISTAEIITGSEKPAIPVLNPLHDRFTPELELLALVSNDEEISNYLLGKAPDDESRQLVQLIARAAQWDSILELWERFCSRCKARQGAALPEERAILDGCLKIHNLIWQSRQADFTHASIGTSFDYRKNQRGTPTGETIQAEWLPGLANASGTTQKLPLVATR